MASSGSDAARLLEALWFAALKHRDQRRRDSRASPFINHPIETVHLLVWVGAVTEITTLLAAILHDILEDTQTTAEELEQRFGVEVRRLVEEVTDPIGLSTDARRAYQLERIARVSPPARMIRLADKIANLRSLPVEWSLVECQKYLAWAEQVGAAVRGTNVRLDDLFDRALRRARASLTDSRRDARPRNDTTAASEGSSGENPEEFARLVRRLQTTLIGAEEQADAIVMWLGEKTVPRRPVPTLLSTVASRSESRGRKPKSRYDDPELRRLAEPGVGSVEFRPLDQRSVLVSIDGAEAFPAPVGLADLLSKIASSEKPDADGFVRFQSLEEVARQLGAQRGGACKTHCVTAAVGRLRKLLRRKGRVNPLLVETCRKRGVRFRLRQRSPVIEPITCDAQPRAEAATPVTARRSGSIDS